jgi:undecaprenyl-diphosphatase
VQSSPTPEVRRLSARAVERFGLRLVLVSAAVALVAIPFNALTVQVVIEGPVTGIDGDLADALNRAVHDRDEVVWLLQAVSWMGRPPFLVVLVAVAAVVLWRQGQHRLIPFVVLVPLFGSFVNTAVKLTVDRPRPEVDHPITEAFGNSYPSGHSFSSVVTYGVLLVAFLPAVPAARRTFVAAAVGTLVLAIGLTRLLLGVHFLTDVVAGFMLGLAFLLAAIATFQAWKRAERVRRR